MHKQKAEQIYLIFSLYKILMNEAAIMLCTVFIDNTWTCRCHKAYYAFIDLKFLGIHSYFFFVIFTKEDNFMTHKG